MSATPEVSDPAPPPSSSPSPAPWRGMAEDLRAVGDRLRTSFFVVPALAVVVAYVAARWCSGVAAADWVGVSTVDSARIVLSTVAGATITFASIAFSVSLLIMQQGSSQLSPRMIHGLVRDPFQRRVIAVVLATFTFCLVTLQRVHDATPGAGDAVVPSLSVSVGVVLGLVAVLAVVAGIHHTAQLMDVSQLLGRVVRNAQDVPPGELVGTPVDPADFVVPADDAPSWVLAAPENGWVRRVERSRLLAQLPPGSVVRLDVEPGRYVAAGVALCTVWPPPPGADARHRHRHLAHCFKVGPTRTMVQDRSYGMRQLVDVALKALSPAVNDPTTALDAMVHLASLLIDDLTAPEVPVVQRDERGRVLWSRHGMTDDEVAELAVAELRHTTAGEPVPTIYLLEMIGAVVRAVDTAGGAARTASLRDQAALVITQAESSVSFGPDLDRIRRAAARNFGGDGPGR